MATDFAKKITSLLQLLLILSVNGSIEAREIANPGENGNVLRIHSMDHHVRANPTTSSHMDHINPTSMVFFRLPDLKLGNKMPIYFPMKDPSNSPPLLRREEADSIPFSSQDLPYLLELFSLSRSSPQAAAMENTLKECAIKPIKGETKHCATSAESMLDYVRETFGPNAQFKVLSTTHFIKSSTLLDNYTIVAQPVEIPVPKMVACHTMLYPYTIFYCHSQETQNRVFVVSLAGDHGGRVDAVAVCHMDTSQWSRDHASFRVLGIEPGSSHVCHFFRGDNFVYAPVVRESDVFE